MLRSIRPGEMQDDPHAGHYAHIAKYKQLLADLKLCSHKHLTILGCRGCAARAEAKSLLLP